MRKFLPLLVAAVISLLAYILLFGFLVSRPLVIDQIDELLARKIAYARSTSHPKLFVVAGSNARFSHSCAALEAGLGHPCVNMGIAADVALDWILDKTRAELAPGDLVYLPLEYDAYSRSRVQMMTGMDAAWRFRHDQPSLVDRGPEGLVRAAFMFSLPTLIHSLGEMTLKAVGVGRRFSVDTLDRQGDETGHDGPKAEPYVALIRRAQQVLPDPATLMENPDGGQAALAIFLEWCRAHNVTAVGGLPTTFNDRPVPDVAVASLRQFYANHGARFLVLPSRSQYARSAFYDSPYHLRESAQLHHSQSLVSSLRPLLQQKP